MEKKTYPPYTYTDDKGFLHLSEEDASVGLIENIDIDSQLNAIYQTFKIIEKAKQNEIEIIKNLEKKSINKNDDSNNPFSIVDCVVDAYNHSVYFDAANSMSTVGMIAPTLESIMYEVFKNIGRKYGESILKSDSKRLKGTKEKWDCHFFYDTSPRKNLTKGILQLLTDTGLGEYFPEDFGHLIDALFSYRNKMFHNGFEWPEKERKKFQKKIKDSHWPDSWFSCSTVGNQPWVFYMSDTFQSKCLNTFKEIIKRIGRFYLDNMEKLI